MKIYFILEILFYIKDNSKKISNTNEFLNDLNKFFDLLEKKILILKLLYVVLKNIVNMIIIYLIKEKFIMEEH